MKQWAYQKYKYSADLYKFVIESIGSTENVNYYFAKNISINASIDDSQRLTVKVNQPIQIGSLLANITDANNELILDDAIWQITNISPVLNAFNAIEGYRCKAIKYQGEI